LKKTLNDLAEFAISLSRKKFQKLSSKKQHEIIAAMAYQLIEKTGYGFFLERYEELHSWAALDRYTPPTWLTPEEALLAFYEFHNAFCPDPVKPAKLEKSLEGDLTWNPSFDVQIMLDQIRSPYNAGSVLRLIDNFGFRGLIHSSPTLSFNHSQLKKAARGCERWVPVTCENDPVSFLKNVGIPVIGIEKTDTAVELTNWKPPSACILIAGNEEYGISKALLECCTETVQIEMFGFKKSMNVHHAISVVSQKIIEVNRRTGFLHDDVKKM